MPGSLATPDTLIRYETLLIRANEQAHAALEKITKAALPVQRPIPTRQVIEDTVATGYKAALVEAEALQADILSHSMSARTYLQYAGNAHMRKIDPPQQNDSTAPANQWFDLPNFWLSLAYAQVRAASDLADALEFLAYGIDHLAGWREPYTKNYPPRNIPTANPR